MDNALIRSLFDAAVAAASAERCVPACLPPRPRGRTVIVAYGKAAAAMARAVETRWDGPLGGMAVTRYGHGVPCERVEVLEAAHPHADAVSRRAAERALILAAALGPDDLLLCLASGGGSALLSLPAPGLSADAKGAIVARLLRCGATIAEINTVRRHLSAIKGGRLAAATRARVHTIVISDVPGDDPALVASGPSLGDGSTPADARAVLARHGIEAPAALGAPPPDVPPGTIAVAATARTALEAARDAAVLAGLRPVILSDAIEGEARDVGAAHAALARAAAPGLLLSGGETTVTVTGHGRGGRNMEYALGLALALDGHQSVRALAADTDGIDGTEAAAGAFIDPDTLARAAALGIDVRARLADNDAFGVFDTLGDTLMTGPTRTNVNDFRAILIG